MPEHVFDRIEACLFDMDGTLLDSTPVVERVWRAWCAKHDIDVEHVLRICHGRQSSMTMAEVAPHLDIAAEAKTMLELELAATDGILPIDGVHAFLRQLPVARWAIVTSAQRALAKRRLQVTNIAVPPVFIAAEDTRRSKPDPQGFLRAAELLGVDPANCLVFEDSLAGLEAGRRGGMHTLQIGASNPPRSAESPFRVRDYKGLSAAMHGDAMRIEVQAFG